MSIDSLNGYESIEFIQMLFNQIPNAVFYKDENLNYRFCNEAFAEFLGLTVEEIEGASVFDVSPEEHARVYHEADLEMVEHQDRQEYEYFVQAAKGQQKRVIFSKDVVKDQNGIFKGIIGTIQDITEKYNNSKKLEMLYKVKDAFISLNRNIMNYPSEKAFFEDILRQVHQVFDECRYARVIQVKADGAMEVIVRRGTKSDYNLSCLKSQMVRYEQWATSSDTYSAIIIENIDSRLCTVNDEHIDRSLCHVKEGEMEVKSSLHLPLAISGRLGFVMTFDSDKESAFTKNHQWVANYIIEQLPIIFRAYNLHQFNLKVSKYDGLTEFYNRKTFDRILESRLDYAHITRENIILAILDMDRVGQLNVRASTEAGDRYILGLRDLLRTIEAQDTVLGRIGGDEFAVMFSNQTMSEAESKLVMLRQAFSEQEFQWAHADFSGGFSYGLAEYDVDGRKKHELFRAADKRMREMK